MPTLLDRAVWRNFLTLLLLGWWSIPSFVMTPFVLRQNVIAALGSGSLRLLDVALAGARISLADVEIGPDGLTGEQRRRPTAPSSRASSRPPCRSSRRSAAGR